MKTHVDAEDARPAGKPGECFYCLRKVGEEHTWECVIPERLVKVRATISWEVAVPRSWTPENVADYKESHACIGNLAHEIQQYSDRLDEKSPNTCQVEHPAIEYLGEVPE